MQPNTKPVENESFASADLYRLRDQLARKYKPADDFERTLVTLAARALIQLQKAHGAQDRAFAEHDPYDLMTTQRDLFKMVTKFVKDSEAIWNRALLAIHRAQRMRQQSEKPGKGPNFDILKPIPWYERNQPKLENDPDSATPQSESP